MAKVYRSKIGFELVIPLALIVGSALLPALLNGAGIVGMLISFPVILFIVHLFLTTTYTVDGKVLKIKSGFLYYKEIDIQTIRKITETNSLLSAPATSLDRLEIVYNTYGSVVVSPKAKKEFIANIQNLNPEVQFVLKSRRKK